MAHDRCCTGLLPPPIVLLSPLQQLLPALGDGERKSEQHHDAPS